MSDRLMVSVSGVRGTVGGTLTPRVACEFGSAYATMLGAGKTVTVGRDSRTSGPMIRGALTAGLLAGGVSVVDLGIASTPACAWMTRKLGCDGGVIITASHNPAQYNGMKFLQPIGTGLVAADAERLKKIWESGEFALADRDRPARTGQPPRSSELFGVGGDEARAIGWRNFMPLYWAGLCEAVMITPPLCQLRVSSMRRPASRRCRGPPRHPAGKQAADTPRGSSGPRSGYPGRR